jgi:regulator of RNase E activity RraB
MDLDRHILKLLKKRGSNFRVPHAIEFYIYFKTKALAKKASVKIKKEGFAVHILSDSSANRWICLSIKDMLPQAKAIGALKRKFNKLAKPYGGFCDGWGTQVEK